MSTSTQRKNTCLRCVLVCVIAILLTGADVESRRLTHYVPQDLLETAVRSESWTEIPLKVKGGILKGDRVRIWAGGSIDRGGDQPGQNVSGPAGERPGVSSQVSSSLVLSSNPAHAFALLLKNDGATVYRSPAPGQPLEIKMSKDAERLWVGFNDEKGHFQDNHLGRGRQHEFDPLWVRVEVVRTIVD
jgi:hypothetical protein